MMINIPTGLQYNQLGGVAPYQSEPGHYALHAPIGTQIEYCHNILCDYQLGHDTLLQHDVPGLKITICSQVVDVVGGI